MSYIEILKMRQRMSLDDKIKLSKIKIKQFYELMNGNVAVSFSGGKDSTVLLHLARSIYPEVKAVFFNTTNEDKRIIQFIKIVDNVDIVNPDKTFKWSLLYEGYPLISKEVSETLYFLFKYTYEKSSLGKTIIKKFTGVQVSNNKVYNFKFPKKWLWLIDINMFKTLEDLLYNSNNELVINELREIKQYYYDVSLPIRSRLGIKDTTRIKLTSKCCDYLKKIPSRLYQKKYNVGIYLGVMASDSSLRKTQYTRQSCIMLDSKKAVPMLWWTEEDVWNYVKQNNLKISSAYETEKRTGCIMCGFGIQFDYTRFDRVREVMPFRYKQYSNLKNIDSDVTFGEAVDIILNRLDKK